MDGMTKINRTRMKKYGRIAQLVEPSTHIREVGDSNSPPATIHYVAMVKMAKTLDCKSRNPGSNPGGDCLTMNKLPPRGVGRQLGYESRLRVCF